MMISPLISSEGNDLEANAKLRDIRNWSLWAMRAEEPKNLRQFCIRELACSWPVADRLRLRNIPPLQFHQSRYYFLN
jgi:hypothetical protein